MAEPHCETQDEHIYGSAKASRFQFKSTAGRRSKRQHHGTDVEEETDDRTARRSKRCAPEEERDSNRGRGHAQRPKKHRRKDHDHDNHHTFTRTGGYDDPERRHRESLYDDLNKASPDVDSEALFRESIFDAMADDEGADYWEGVYGQPIHIYPNAKTGPDGTLERMTDDEYADFVRTKMWEKTHEHMIEERAARERARQKRRQRNRHLEEEVSREEEERENIRRQMEASLQRGAERKKARLAEASWAEYCANWDRLKSLEDPAAENPQSIIPWPVISGEATSVEPRAVEEFLKLSSSWKQEPLALLKSERVRWHPDKMQQRFGQYIDTGTMKLVTAVFQVIDRLWNERNLRR